MIIYLVEPARHRRRGARKAVGRRRARLAIRDCRDIRETHLQQFLLFLAHRLGHFVRPAREKSVRCQCANARASPESLERRGNRQKSRVTRGRRERRACGRISPVERRKPSRVARVRGLITPNTRWRPRTRLLVNRVLGCIHHFRRGACVSFPSVGESRASERETVRKTKKKARGKKPKSEKKKTEKPYCLTRPRGPRRARRRAG